MMGDPPADPLDIWLCPSSSKGVFTYDVHIEGRIRGIWTRSKQECW